MFKVDDLKHVISTMHHDHGDENNTRSAVCYFHLRDRDDVVEITGMAIVCAEGEKISFAALQDWGSRRWLRGDSVSSREWGMVLGNDHDSVVNTSQKVRKRRVEGDHCDVARTSSLEKSSSRFIEQDKSKESTLRAVTTDCSDRK